MEIKTAALVALIGVCLALLGHFYFIFDILQRMISYEFYEFEFMYIAATVIVIKTLTWAALAYFFYMLYRKS